MSGIVLFGVWRSRPNRIKQIIMENGCFGGMLLVIFVTIAKIGKIQAKQRIKLRNLRIADELLNKE